MANNNKFMLDVAAILNTENIDKKLQEMSRTTKIKVEADGTEKIIKDTRTMKDEFGNVIKTVTTANSQTKTLSSNIEKTTKEQKKFRETLELSVKQMNKMEASSKGTFKEFNRGGSSAVTQTNKLETEMKQLTQEMQKQLVVSGKLDKSTIDSLKQRQKLVNAELQTMKAQNAQSNGNFMDSFGKVATFGAVTAGIGAITSAVYKAKESIMEMDAAIVEFTKVSDLSGEKLEGYKNQIIGIGKELGRTGIEVLQTATEFKKAGYSEEDTKTLARVSTLYQNIADEQVSAGQASSFIISQLKAFNIEASESERIIDTVNEVSNRFAVSSADLANNLGRSSAVLANSGVTLEKSLGLITAGTEILRDAGVVSNGLKTISLRLSGMSEEGEKLDDLIPKLESDFNKLGLTLIGSNGDMKDTFTIMQELSEVFPTLSNAQKAYYTELIAGKNQAQVASAILSNFSTAIEANEAALNSNGSAMREQEKYMESLQAKTNQLKSAFDEWSQQFKPIVSGILDLANAIMTLENKTGILMPLLAGLALTMIPALKGALVSLGTTLGFATGGLSLLIPAIVGVVSAFTILPKVTDAATVTLEEQEEVVSSLTAKVSGLSSELDTLYSKENQSASDKLRIEVLERELELNEQLLEAENQRLEEQRKNELPEQLKEIQDEFITLMSIYSSLTELGDKSPLSGAFNIGDTNTRLIEVAQELNTFKGEIVGLYDSATSSMKEFYDGLLGQIDSSLNALDELVGVQEEAIEVIEDVNEGVDVQAQLLVNLQKATEDITQETKDLTDAMGTLDSAIAKVSEGERLNHSEIMKLIEINPSLRKEIQETNGMYTITEESLKRVRDEQYNTAMQTIQSQKDSAQAVINSATSSIAAYQAQINALKDLARAQATLYGSMSQNRQQMMYGSTLADTAVEQMFNDKIQEQADRAKAAQEALDKLNISELALKVSVSNSASKVSEYNSTLKENAKAKGNSTKEAEKLAKEVGKAKDRFVKFKESVHDANKSLNALNNNTIDLVKNMEQLKTGDFTMFEIDQDKTLEELEPLIVAQRDTMAKLYSDLETLKTISTDRLTEQEEKALNKQVAALKENIKIQEGIYKGYATNLENIRKNMYQDALDSYEKELKAYEDMISKEVDRRHKQTQDEIEANKKRLKSKQDLIKSQKDALEKLQDLTLDYIKQQKDSEIEALDERKKAVEDLANSKKKALREDKESRDYAKTLKKKEKDISTIEKRIAELQFDTSAKGIAERLELEEKLAQEKDSLEDIQYDNSIKKQEDAIDEQAKKEKEALNKQIKELKDYLSKEGQMRDDANKLIESGSRDLYDKLSEYNKDYVGMTEKELSSMFDLAMEGLDDWGGSIGSVNDAFDNMADAIDRVVDRLEELNEIQSQTKEEIREEVEEEEGYKKPIKPSDKPSSEKPKNDKEDFGKLRDDVIRQMQRNSRDWNSASSSERESLARENENLAKKIGAWKSQKNGAWYVKISGKDYNINDGQGIGVRHTGIEHPENAFIGGRSLLKSNEEFIKAMKGEIVANPQQMDKFMNDHLPELISSSNEYMGSKNGMNIGNFMEIIVQGNLDKGMIPDLEKIKDSGIAKLVSQLGNSGYRTGARSQRI